MNLGLHGNDPFIVGVVKYDGPTPAPDAACLMIAYRKRQPSNAKNLRRTRRQELSYQVWIEIEGEAQLRACRLFDISPEGAGLTVKAPELVPDTFFLLLSKAAAHRRQCWVAWRAEDRIGVSFVEPARAEDKGADEAAKPAP